MNVKFSRIAGMTIQIIVLDDVLFILVDIQRSSEQPTLQMEAEDSTEAGVMYLSVTVE